MESARREGRVQMVKKIDTDRTLFASLGEKKKPNSKRMLEDRHSADRRSQNHFSQQVLK